MKILIADDHQIISIGLEQIIRRLYPQCIIDNAVDYKEVTSQLRLSVYDLIILDFNMPGLNNFDGIAAIRSCSPGSRILIYSSYKESLYAIPCLNAGADGYLSKELPTQIVADAIRQLMMEGRYTSDEIKTKLAGTSNGAGSTSRKLDEMLSQRELEVFNLLSKGEGLLEISNILNITISSAATYKRRLFKKLSVSNLAELITTYASGFSASGYL